jgi:Tol biopolymer transport system component
VLVAGLVVLVWPVDGGTASPEAESEGVTWRVSVGPGGVQANSRSQRPAISANGRYVAFASAASNLVAGDTNGISDVFVRDRAAHVTRRVSVGPGGAPPNQARVDVAISADGRYVAFQSYASNLVARDTNDTWDVFVRVRSG